MHVKSDELMAKYVEFMDSFPKDEDGCEILPEGVAEPRVDMTIDEYLAAKFPEASAEDLHRDYDGVIHADYSEHPEFTKLQRAFEIDHACAFCIHRNLCRLPEGCDPKAARPEAALFTNKKGEVCLGTKWVECIKCKQPEEDQAEEERLAAEERRAEQQKAEFERKVKVCGLSPKQKEHTFARYDHDASRVLAGGAFNSHAALRHSFDKGPVFF